MRINIRDLDKDQAYNDLVQRRKTCNKCNGLCNPSTFDYDSDQIGSWTLWQGNLNSDIVVVGQDWGDVTYFEKWKGKDQPKDNPTNENLQRLMEIINIKVEKPSMDQNHIVFLTNLILCLKTGGLQATVEDHWFENCSSIFFRPLMNIIKPKIVIALGKKVSESILNIYDIPYSKSTPYYELINKSPVKLTSSLVLFPVYHCGAGSINRNRPMEEQKDDWRKIAQWLKENN